MRRLLHTDSIVTITIISMAIIIIIIIIITNSIPTITIITIIIIGVIIIVTSHRTSNRTNPQEFHGATHTHTPILTTTYPRTAHQELLHLNWDPAKGPQPPLWACLSRCRMCAFIQTNTLK